RMDRAAGEGRGQYVRARKFAFSVILLAIVVAVGIAAFASRHMMRELRTRIKVEQAIKDLNRDLEGRVMQRTQELEHAEGRVRKSLEDLQAYTKDIEIVNGFIELLQSCLTLEEAYQQVGKVLPRFFPAGTLLM